MQGKLRVREGSQHTVLREAKDTAMIDTDIDLEEPNILNCDLSDETLESAADVLENPTNVTWYYCPTGLVICRV
jgi:hypothetical protein